MSSNQGLININSIYSTQGKLKKDWEYFIKDINNDSCSDKIVSLLNQNMKDTPKNELTVDIIDFIIDYGNQKMISLIAQKQFLDIFLNLLKSETNAGVEIQKKVIYLTQKWSKKYNGNQNYSIFMDNYNFLKKNGIVFPPDSFVLKTYDNYISKEDIQTFLNNNQNNNIDLFHYKCVIFIMLKIIMTTIIFQINQIMIIIIPIISTLIMTTTFKMIIEML